MASRELLDFAPFLWGGSKESTLSYTISHVYWECNLIADTVSKAGLGRSSGIMHYRYYLVENKELNVP